MNIKYLTLLSLAVLALAAVLGAAVTYASNADHGGDIIFIKPVKAVLFSHKFHAEDMGLSCETCHDTIFPMGGTQDKEDFTMKSLYAGKYCGTCHDGKSAFGSDTQCNRCHIGVKGHTAATGGDKKEATH